MTYIDVQPHIHWKLKGLSDVDVARQTISEDSFFSFGVGGLAPQASYAIMLQVYDDYNLLTAICIT